MGFLLAGFGKQMAGTRKRTLQARMMRIQTQVRHVQRDYDRMKKSIEREEKAAKNAAQFENQSALAIFGNQLLGNMQRIAASLGKDQNMSTNNDYMIAQMQYSQQEATEKTKLQYKMQQIEDYYENLKESLLEPLKDEEEELSSEKDMLESQYKVAEEDYQACQKMEQSDAKMLAPNYTGGQG